MKAKRKRQFFVSKFLKDEEISFTTHLRLPVNFSNGIFSFKFVLSYESPWISLTSLLANTLLTCILLLVCIYKNKHIISKLL